MRLIYLPLLTIGSLALGGCVAGVAASAVGAAVNASQPRETNEDLRRPAVAACTARAIEHGEVHIIDAEQRRGGRVTVWGTVTTPEQRPFAASHRLQSIHDALTFDEPTLTSVLNGTMET